MDVLTPEGVYIAFNGSFLYVWLGKGCDVSVLHDMFGFASVDQADGARLFLYHAADSLPHPLQQAPSFMPRTSVQCVLLAFLCSLVDFGFITFFCVRDRSRRCCNVLRSVQALVPHSCPIQMVKQGGQLEIKFHMCLIEDRSVCISLFIFTFLKLIIPICSHMNLLSYSEWWAALGRQSQ